MVSTKRREKIEYISKLFLSYAKEILDDEHDEYEELLLILDELTLREIKIVMRLKQYENKHPIRDDENELQRAIDSG